LTTDQAVTGLNPVGVTESEAVTNKVTAFFVRIFGGFGVVLGHLFKPVCKPTAASRLR
jgi:hypothetical protein